MKLMLLLVWSLNIGEGPNEYKRDTLNKYLDAVNFKPSGFVEIPK